MWVASVVIVYLFSRSVNQSGGLVYSGLSDLDLSIICQSWLCGFFVCG